MIRIEFTEHDVTINGINTKVHVANLQDDLFLTLFTQQPKDFINGFGAKGMTTQITRLGDMVPIHSAIKIKGGSTLPDEIMSNLWAQISN